MRTLLLSAPSGGLVTDPPPGGGSIARELDGLWHHGGRLRSMEGRQWLSDLPRHTFLNGSNFANHFVYQAASGTSYVVAQIGRWIWLGIPASTTVATATVADATTIPVTSSSNFPWSGTALVSGAYCVSYTNKSTGNLLGCGTHPTLSVGDTVQILDWRPLWGQYNTGPDDSRSTSRRDNFVQVGSILYGAGAGMPWRWSGFETHAGSCNCTGTNSVVTAVGTDWTAAGVNTGDVIYFFRQGTGGYLWNPAAGYVVTSVSSTTLTVLGTPPATTAQGPAGSNNCEYVVVRTARMGIPMAGTCATGVAYAGSMDAGKTFRYKCRYVSSKTGYKGVWGVASTWRTLGAGEGALDVYGGWTDFTQTRTENHVDGVEIYRERQDNAGVWHYVTTLTPLTSADHPYLFDTHFIDASADATLTTTISNTDGIYYIRPTTNLGACFRIWNDSLWAAGVSDPHIIYKSTGGQYEYWPASGTTTYGGYMAVGDGTGDPITETIPEVGAYSSTGRTGAALLILTKTQGKRLYGSNWADFVLDPAFPMGCVASGTGANRGGMLSWLAKTGPVTMVSGAPMPQLINQALWPDGLNKAILADGAMSLLSTWKSTSFGDWIVLAGNDGNTTALYLCHVPSQTWTSRSLQASVASLTVWNGPNDDGQVTIGETAGTLYRLFALGGSAAQKPSLRGSYWTPKASWNPTGPTGVDLKWRSDDIAFEDAKPSDLKEIKRLVFCFRAPSVGQELTARIVAEGDSGNPVESTTLTVPVGTGNTVYVEWYPNNAIGHALEIVLQGTVTRRTDMEWVQVQYQIIGRGSDA